MIELKEGIQFDRVEFRYPTAHDTSPSTFTGISFLIKAGTSTAIVGPSGSGKSTIVQLINRLYDPTRGMIRFGSDDIRTLSLAQLREQVGYVGQEPVLILGTIRENLKYGNADATEQDMQKALALAKAEFVDTLENGLDTYVGSGSILNLSGG